MRYAVVKEGMWAKMGYEKVIEFKELFTNGDSWDCR
jgi:hypothetical protein